MHHEWYQSAVKFAKTVGTTPSVKRIAGQTLHENYSTSTPKEYYRVALTVPFLDQVISELENRFSEQHRVHANVFFVILSVILKNEDWKSFIRQFSQQYKSDLPSKLNLEVEMNEWEQLKLAGN